jgi:hypothetical protein
VKKLFLISVVLLLLAACTAEPTTITETVEVPVTVEVVQEVEVTREVEVVQEIEVTRIVTEEVTRIVETMVEVTATPTPQPAEFLVIEGTGDQVTDNFDWQPCDKAIFGYSAAGTSNFIVYLWKVGVDENRLLINEIAPAEGEALQPILGGAYWLEVEANGGWTITAVCED